MHLLDKVLQHFLGDVEIGDNTIFHWPDGTNVTRRSAQHALSFGTYRSNTFRASSTFLANSNNGGFIQHDALIFYVDQCIGCSEVDGQIVREHASKFFKHEVVFPVISTCHCAVKCGNKAAGRDLTTIRTL